MLKLQKNKADRLSFTGVPSGAPVFFCLGFCVLWESLPRRLLMKRSVILAAEANSPTKQKRGYYKWHQEGGWVVRIIGVFGLREYLDLGRTDLRFD